MSYRDNRYTPKVVDCIEINKLDLSTDDGLQRHYSDPFAVPVDDVCTRSTAGVHALLAERRAVAGFGCELAPAIDNP